MKTILLASVAATAVLVYFLIKKNNLLDPVNFQGSNEGKYDHVPDIYNRNDMYAGA